MNPPDLKSMVNVHLSRGALVGLAAALLAPWVFVGAFWISTQPHFFRFKTPTKPTVSSARGFVCKPGPWGEMECARIIIEPPDEFISVSAHMTAQVKWIFREFSKEQLVALSAAAGLKDAHHKSLLAKAKRDPSVNGFVVAPDKELIWGLAPSQRAAIYSALAPFQENRFQCEPFRFRADTASEWFENCDLPPKTIAMVRGLLYQRGTSLLFSDIESVLPLLSDSLERVQLLKTLSRKATLLMKLRLHRGSNLESLVRYWGKGGRSKDLEPLLRSLMKGTEEQRIDVVHLLPVFARMRLYTYPFSMPDAVSLRQDCCWTALNFFNRDVDDRFTSVDQVHKTLMSDYYQVVGEPTFGDLIAFTKPNGEAIHVATYLADNILFTKNGTLYQPWILMTMEDMIAFYPSEPALQALIYRSKAL